MSVSSEPSPPAFEVKNPLLKPVWNEEDLFFMCALLETSSGRSGEDAITKAAETAQLIVKKLLEMKGTSRS